MTDTPAPPPGDATGTPGMCEAYEQMQHAVTLAATTLAHLGTYRALGEPGSLLAAERAMERALAELDQVLPWLAAAAAEVAPGRASSLRRAVFPMGTTAARRYDAPHDGPPNAPQ